MPDDKGRTRSGARPSPAQQLQFLQVHGLQRQPPSDLQVQGLAVLSSIRVTEIMAFSFCPGLDKRVFSLRTMVRNQQKISGIVGGSNACHENHLFTPPPPIWAGSEHAMAKQDKVQAERRRANRTALRLTATMRDGTRSRSQVRLIDMSTHGCRVECPSGVADDSWLWLSIGGLETQYCRVVWHCEEFVGLEFETPLSEAVFDRLLEDQSNCLRPGSTNCARSRAGRIGWRVRPATPTSPSSPSCRQMRGRRGGRGIAAEPAGEGTNRRKVTRPCPAELRYEGRDSPFKIRRSRPPHRSGRKRAARQFLLQRPGQYRLELRDGVSSHRPSNASLTTGAIGARSWIFRPCASTSRRYSSGLFSASSAKS